MKKAKTDFKEYMEAFDDELQSFLQRVKERAQARIDKALEEAEKVSLNILSSTVTCNLALLKVKLCLQVQVAYQAGA